LNLLIIELFIQPSTSLVLKLFEFNSLTLINLILLPLEERVSLDGKNKAKMMGQLHEGVQLQIEKRNKLYAYKTNKGRKHVIFQLNDWVWVHMHEEQFPNHGKSKL
jgi:hypothetical protein